MNFTRPFLTTIKARTLIIHGDRDEFFPVEIPVEMYKFISDSQLWIVPHGGHVTVDQMNDAFMPKVSAFLEGDESKP